MKVGVLKTFTNSNIDNNHNNTVKVVGIMYEGVGPLGLGFRV